MASIESSMTEEVLLPSSDSNFESLCLQAIASMVMRSPPPRSSRAVRWTPTILALTMLLPLLSVSQSCPLEVWAESEGVEEMLSISPQLRKAAGPDQSCYWTLLSMWTEPLTFRRGVQFHASVEAINSAWQQYKHDLES